MPDKQASRDTISDVVGCIREGLVYYVEETGFGEINIKLRIFKEGLVQVDVDRGPTFRFYIERGGAELFDDASPMNLRL